MKLHGYEFILYKNDVPQDGTNGTPDLRVDVRLYKKPKKKPRKRASYKRRDMRAAE